MENRLFFTSYLYDCERHCFNSWQNLLLSVKKSWDTGSDTDHLSSFRFLIHNMRVWLAQRRTELRIKNEHMLQNASDEVRPLWLHPPGSLGGTALRGHAHEVGVNAELRREAEQIMVWTQNIFVTNFPRLLFLSEKWHKTAFTVWAQLYKQDTWRKLENCYKKMNCGAIECFLF